MAGGVGATTIADRHPSFLMVMAAFVGFGIFWGNWAVGLVNIQRSFHLSDGGLGLLLAASLATAGLVGAYAARRAERFGPERLLALSLSVWIALLALAAAMPHFVEFGPIFALAVCAGGCVDTAMNYLAARQMNGRPGSLVRVHALFNTGAVIGALYSGLILRLGLSWRAGWWILAGPLGILALVGWRSAVTHGPTVEAIPVHAPNKTTSGLGLLKSLHRQHLLVLMLLFTLAETTEGGVDTWGVLYLRTRLAAGVLLGAGAYALGQGAAALTRGTGGRALGRLGTRRAVLLGASVVMIGMAIEGNVSTAAVAGIGLALGACGASLFWPLVVSEVADSAEEPMASVGLFTAAGYVGLVAGAPIVGWIADNFGLGRGIDLLGGFGAAVVVLQLIRIRRSPHPIRPE